MFNLSETVKISCHYELFTTAGAIFRETDRTNLYSQYIKIKIVCRHCEKQLNGQNLYMYASHVRLKKNLKSWNCHFSGPDLQISVSVAPILFGLVAIERYQWYTGCVRYLRTLTYVLVTSQQYIFLPFFLSDHKWRTIS